MSPVYEPSQFKYAIAPQSAQAVVPLPADYHQLNVTAGDLGITPDIGQLRHPTYGQRFYSGIKWINSLQGQGDLTSVGDPSAIAALAAFFLGDDTFTAAGAGPQKHVIIPAPGSPWLAVHKLAGVAEGSGGGAPRRERYNDCRIGQLVIAGSTESKAVVATSSFFSADPAEIVHANQDPTAALTTEQGFVFTDGEGAFKLDADTGTPTVFSSFIGFTITMNDVLNPVPGDSARPIGFINGESTVTCEVTLSAETESIKELNKLIYGVLLPAPGLKPLSGIRTDGSLDIKLSKAGLTGVNVRSLQVVLDGVSWNAQGSLGTNTDGTPSPIVLQGEARLRGVNPMIEVIVEGGATAAYL